MPSVFAHHLLGRQPNIMRILHMIPYDGVGGVESAARTLSDGDYGSIQFKKYYLVKKYSDTRAKFFCEENNPVAYLRSVREIIALKPDILVASLWRSCFTALVVKIFRPKTKLITFLHNAFDEHWLDYFITRVSILLSNSVWVDSDGTLTQRSTLLYKKSTRKISFVAKRLIANPENKLNPKFVFWGRLATQKNLPKMLTFFSKAGYYWA